MSQLMAFSFPLYRVAAAFRVHCTMMLSLCIVFWQSCIITLFLLYSTTNVIIVQCNSDDSGVSSFLVLVTLNKF